MAAALDGAVDGDVSEGCVGAGTGMQCFDFKGGIGTASRVLPADAGSYTVGALVLTNFGSRPDLRIDGVRVGEQITDLMPVEHTEGSCVVIVATDAPLLPHQLRRVAQRAGMGLARTGSTASNGSGEQMLAFSTANRIPVRTADPVVDVRAVADARPGDPWLLGELFAATIEATDEAVVNALVAAETIVGRDGNTLFAMPVDRVLPMMERAGRLAASLIVRATSRRTGTGRTAPRRTERGRPGRSTTPADAVPAPRITPSDPWPVATTRPSRSRPTSGRSSGVIGRRPHHVERTCVSRERRDERDRRGELPPGHARVLGLGRDPRLTRRSDQDRAVRVQMQDRPDLGSRHPRPSRRARPTDA